MNLRKNLDTTHYLTAKEEREYTRLFSAYGTTKTGTRHDSIAQWNRTCAPCCMDIQVA